LTPAAFVVVVYSTVPERSDVITAKDLETLAIGGRDATELIRMLPG
jgi:hypothetical protein